MTDELKHKFEQLVADAPPPTGVPSEGVFERVRAVKRRRRTTAGILATAAVVVAGIAAGNLTSLNSAPDPANTPGPTPIVTGPPTVSPTTTPPPTSRSTIVGSVNTLPPVQGSDTPPPSGPSSPSTKATSPGLAAPPGPYKLNFSFATSTVGLTGRINIVATGDVLAPVFEEGGTVTSSKFHDNLLYSEYWWGDGTHVVEDKYGGMFCPQPDQPKTMKKVSGQGVRPMSHTFAKAGEYQFAYRVTYCTPSGPVKFARAWDITVFDPASPSP
jgi:hypothetical protein